MNHRERVIAAINHTEADRVPLDLGGTHVTTMTAKAYARLRKYLGFKDKLTPGEVTLCNFPMQLVKVDEDFLDRMDVDTRGVFPNAPDTWSRKIFVDGEYNAFIDEWGITWHSPKEGGIYYDMVKHPLVGASEEALDQYPWPKGEDKGRTRGLRAEAEPYRKRDYFVTYGNTIGNGFLHMGTWIEGYEDYYVHLLTEPRRVAKLLAKVLELKIAYWDNVLDELGGVIDIAYEADDLGTQLGLMISPDTYRKFVKPYEKELFAHIKKRRPGIKIFFHSCGSIHAIIPDLIEVGVDILNPIQVSAVGMDPVQLKKAYGKDLTFWGGGVDTQFALPFGTPQQVKDDVKKRIETLAPGGGFVFASVHNIQDDVPPENIVAMWEAWKEFGKYR